MVVRNCYVVRCEVFPARRQCGGHSWVKEAGLEKGAGDNAMVCKDVKRKEVVRRPDELSLVYSPTGFAFVMVTPSRLQVGHGQRVLEKGHCLYSTLNEGFFPTWRLLLFALEALLSVPRIWLAILQWCQDSSSRSVRLTAQPQMTQTHSSSMTMGMKKGP